MKTETRLLIGQKNCVITKETYGCSTFIRPYRNICSLKDFTTNTTGAIISWGGVGIGGAVNVVGIIKVPAFNATSDYRIKQNAHSICDDASFNVDVLRPVTYTNSLAGKQDIGFIAHEVGEHYPYLVNGEKDGEQMQSLNYTGIIGILVKEIQELKGRVAVLENLTNASLP